MVRVNVWVPDELASRARAAGLNISALTQAAISAELAKAAMAAWLDGLDALPKQRRQRPSHEGAMRALDEAREEFGA